MLANDVMSKESIFSKIVILCTDLFYCQILLGLFGLFPPDRVKRRDNLISHIVHLHYLEVLTSTAYLASIVK